MFGIGNVRKHQETIDAQEEMIDNLFELNNQLKDKCVKLEQTLLRQRQPRRKGLTRVTGYKRVSESESLEMYERYETGDSLSDIAAQMHRSQSCVSKHVWKHVEEEDGK